jgi:hypothetical protein
VVILDYHQMLQYGVLAVCGLILIARLLLR